MLGLKPIKLLPARERVASALRKAIIAQQIKEGETLTLETTAQQLGVSITPVREAFQILERDGLISLQQNRGATVLGINEKTLREHYQVRAVLEKAACELCCENGADLSSVKNCIDTAEEALERNDVTDYANQNQSFHYEIWKAAGNGKLEKMLGELWNGLSLGLNSTEEEYARRSQKEHQQIYAALEKRDAALAGKEMEKHIYRSKEAFQQRSAAPELRAEHSRNLKKKTADLSLAFPKGEHAQWEVDNWMLMNQKFSFSENPRGIQEALFLQENDNLEIWLKIDGEEKQLTAGFRKWIRNDLYPGNFRHQYHCLAYAFDGSALRIKVALINTSYVETYTLRPTVAGDSATAIHPQLTCSWQPNVTYLPPAPDNTWHFTATRKPE